MYCKIYKITNNKTGKIYIGQTTKEIDERLKQHFVKARQKKDNNNLHNSMRKHGFKNFTIELIEDNIPLKLVIQKEFEYIKKFDSVNKGYNMKYLNEDPRYKTLVFLEKEELEDLYINQGLSTIQIGKMFGVVNTTVGNRLKFFGIPTRRCGEGNGKLKMSKDELYQLFIVEKKTAQEIADIYGVKRYIIQNLQKKYQIYNYRIVKI